MLSTQIQWSYKRAGQTCPRPQAAQTLGYGSHRWCAPTLSPSTAEHGPGASPLSKRSRSGVAGPSPALACGCSVPPPAGEARLHAALGQPEPCRAAAACVCVPSPASQHPKHPCAGAWGQEGHTPGPSRPLAASDTHFPNDTPQWGDRATCDTTHEYIYCTSLPRDGGSCLLAATATGCL